MDDYLCYRFHKKLRIDGFSQNAIGSAPQAFESVAVAAEESLARGVAYDDMNSFLRTLHAEQMVRRREADHTASSAMDSDYWSARTASVASSSGSNVFTDQFQRLGVGMTNFMLGDVVRCDHSSGGRCLQCSGRFVQNIPMPIYSAFCAACCPTTGGASSALALGRACAGELSLPAMASLTANLAPEPGERMIHLGSGSGRALLAWALLLPHSASSGIEIKSELHAEATSSRQRLPPDVQPRVFLHCGDIFDAQSSWHEASILLVSVTSLDAVAMGRLVDGLQHMQEGTRVVALNGSLCADAGRAPLGFSLARRAAYRTLGGGNCTVFIYRKNGPPE